MRIQRFLGAMLAMCAIVAAVILYNVQSVRGSDHQDSLLLTKAGNEGKDITDVFVYPSPANSANVVLQMNVHPLITPSQANSFALDASTLYQFRIAHGSYTPVTTGNGFSATSDDTVIQFKADKEGTTQNVSVYGPAAPPLGGTSTSQTILPTAAGTVSFNNVNPATFANGMKVFVGPRSDPFFFDLAQFFKIIPDRNYQNQPNPPPPTAGSFQGFASSTVTSGSVTATNCLTTPSTDLLSANHFNVISIIVEMPKSLLLTGGAGSVIGVHATTSTVSGQ